MFVCSWAAVFHLGMFDNIIDTFCRYNFIKILSSFLISVLVSGWNWWMKLPNCPERFRTFHRLSSGVACMHRVIFKELLKVLGFL